MGVLQLSLERVSLMKNLKLLAAAIAALGICTSASAALVSTGSAFACDAHSTEMTSAAGYVDCSGSWSGNNSNQATDVNSQIFTDFGLTVLGGPTGITATSVAGDPTLTFTAQTGVFVISLKAGDAFSLYEFDATTIAGGISSIDYDTLGVGFFKGREHYGQGLSHADLYTVDQNLGIGNPPAVPEPANAALLLMGLGGMFILRRRMVK